MKSQRRHDLQTNTLADNLAEVVEYIKDQAQTIVVGIVAVLVIIGVVWYWQYSAAVSRAQGWQDMLTLVGTTSQQDPDYLDKLERVATSYRDPGLRAMAYDQLGNELFGQATVGAMAPDKAAELRQRAQGAFTNALNDSADRPETAAIAHLGLAAIASDTGDTSAARQHYDAVINDPQLKGTPYPAQAKAQLAALEAVAKLPPLAASTQPVAQKPAPASQG